jgi:ferredoxin, 2Fe-2S
MSVEITFQPAGLSGLVAEGTYVIEAAKRMGVRISTECKGSGECTACVVSIVTGQLLLSAPTEHEQKTLGQEGLAQEQRLACQTRVERSGELVVAVLPEKAASEKDQRPVSDLRKDFAELPLDKKLVTLVQFEALTMSQAMDAIAAKTLSVGGRVIDLFASKGRNLRQRELELRHPPEHRQQKNDD